MSGYKGLFSKLWHAVDPYLPDEQIRAGAHALGGAVRRSAKGGLLHNAGALPGALTGAILRDLHGPEAPAAPEPPMVARPPEVAVPPADEPAVSPQPVSYAPLYYGGLGDWEQSPIYQAIRRGRGW